MQVWHTEDKTDWLAGPWQEEPDKAQWITAAGLDGLIVRGPMGALCGYVGVPPSHPAFKVDFETVDVAVHGGLTFANMCVKTDDEGHGICHTESEAAHPVVWWLGFDCGHAFDVCPQLTRLCREFGDLKGTYRDFPYVLEQVEQLAAQLVAWPTALL